MNDKLVLYVDQFGEKIFANTRKELEAKTGGKARRMYVDGKDGKTYHVGYVVRKQWFRAYVPYRKVVS